MTGFLTLKGRIYLLVSSGKHLTQREMSATVGVAEQNVNRACAAMVRDGILVKHRTGRQTWFTVGSLDSVHELDRSLLDEA